MFNQNNAASLLDTFIKNDTDYSVWVNKSLEQILLSSGANTGLGTDSGSQRGTTGALITTTGVVSLELDLTLVHTCSARLYNYFVNYPVDMIQMLEEQMREIILKELNVSIEIMISPGFNPTLSSVSELSPDQIDTLVTCEAVVIRQSPVRPIMTVGAFQCSLMNPNGTLLCGYIQKVPVVGKKINQPKFCPKCQRKDNMKLMTTMSEYTDIQSLKLQDVKATTSDWSHNHGIVGFVHDPYIHCVRPGDHVKVTALYKAAPARVRPRQTAVKALFKTSLDILHVEKLSSTNKVDFSNASDITEDQLTKFKSMADRQTLIDIFAPGIQLLDHVKLGILCSLVGGNSHEGSTRGSVHVLLCGDPATAKSQLLCAAKDHATRCTYVCGRGSTSAGLTATVVRDQESNEFLLEPGAVVIADQGICCIDEFDKVDESARIVLNELMEQQSVSIAKAGIVCTLNARTSIIACANPISSRFDPRRSITENLNMPLSLISRFDLLFLLTDPNESSYDRKVAKSLLSHFDESKRIDPNASGNSTRIGRDDLTPFLEYAKTVSPVLSEEAQAALKESYKSLRQNVNRGDIVVTTRQLRSLIRLSEALAKLELRESVTASDVEVATQLVRATTTSISSNSGGDGAQHNPAMKARTVILELLKTAGVAGITERDLKTGASQSSGIPIPQVGDMLAVLEKNKEILVRINGPNRMYCLNE